MRKVWMKVFADKPKPKLLEGDIHIFCEPCLAGCCAQNFNRCVIDGFFVATPKSYRENYTQKFVFTGVAHKATVYVHLGTILEMEALILAKTQARYWR
jgi:hypothetical protein